MSYSIIAIGGDKENEAENLWKKKFYGKAILVQGMDCFSTSLAGTRGFG